MMKKIKFVAFFLGALVFATRLYALELRPGDILLQELDCYSCQRISSETASRFSHSALVIRSQNTGELVVAEALMKVRTLPLKEFVQRSAPGASVLVMRSYELDELYEKKGKVLERELTQSFFRSFEGLYFDKLYLWDRIDEQGRPMLYCSEFVVKFLNPFLTEDFQPRPLDFTHNWSFWSRYYDGNVPQGVLGNSPGDLEKDPKLYELGEIWSDDEF